MAGISGSFMGKAAGWMGRNPGITGGIAGASFGVLSGDTVGGAITGGMFYGGLGAGLGRYGAASLRGARSQFTNYSKGVGGSLLERRGTAGEIAGGALSGLISRGRADYGTVMRSGEDMVNGVKKIWAMNK